MVSVVVPGSGFGSGQCLAQSFNNNKFVQNLAFSMSKAALFHRKLAFLFLFLTLFTFYVGFGFKSGSGTARAKSNAVPVPLWQKVTVPAVPNPLRQKVTAPAVPVPQHCVSALFINFYAFGT